MFAACGCSSYGSRRDDCDQTSGACRCRRKAIGLKCNMCPEGLTMTPMGCMTGKKGHFHCQIQKESTSLWNKISL